ncbi:MAG: vanadium-dependent haloperoxidase [Phycisphaerales bacterium]|nr:vanadium-dependent haloperoxidase [Planctomycetota bacterium]MCH8509260.1 vanadium-dependent haloperoxidase [Phycisphaerales bacterium]
MMLVICAGGLHGATDAGSAADPVAPARLPAGTAPLPDRTAERVGAFSAARMWNEELLAAVRRDRPRPPVVSRDLFHVSAAMYDAWAAYDATATGVFRTEWAEAADTAAARREAVSYAAYRLIAHRYADSPGAPVTLPSLDSLMDLLGYDPAVTTRTGPSPAAVGNRIAAAIIALTAEDGSNEAGNYADTSGYAPVNGPLTVDVPGVGVLNDINRWQPLIVPGFSDQQVFLAPHWGAVRPFAIERPSPGELYLDPGPPPVIGGDGDADLRADLLEVIRASAQLDPDDGVMINISPSAVGNNTLGSQDGQGHKTNPSTGQPYPDNMVLRGDWGRVLAEFWADGPLSSTPPGHWNEIANEVVDTPGFERRFGGDGPELDSLEWDVKMYLALNGAVHDAAIATWEVKAHYDFTRPLSLIRGMGALGQSSDPDGASYHPDGLPLEEGLVELITPASAAPGERHEHLADHIGEIALFAWQGHPADPTAEYGGCGWVRAVEWLPYQQFDFVTPPFAGYTSGHSGFSRAAAEVLTQLTGDAFFPGGLGEFMAATGSDGFDLGFEFGPLQDVPLQWATYYDAADEAGISRIYGGIHPAFDDFPGRVIGSNAGIAAFTRASASFSGSAASLCPADFAEPFGVLDFFDVAAFIDAFVAGSPAADLAEPFGVLDFADIAAFFDAYNAGCP